MKLKSLTLIILSALVVPGMLFAGDDDEKKSLSEHLQPLQHLIGKTYKGKFANPDPAAPPVYDVSRWERALNGQAIRIMHSVNDGAYGGETLIVWDKETAGLIFYYFTTGGFYTRGTISIEDGKMVTHEKVVGNEGGVTEVKSISEQLPDGSLKVVTMRFQNGEWTTGNGIIYLVDPDAEVIFR